MNQPQLSLKPNILLAPLDWGLGHATRCIPIVKTLIRLDCNVILAGEEKIKFLLQREFPELVFIDLKGYGINYSKYKWTLPFTIALQIPKIISVIEDENKWVETIADEYAIDGIISDNRYGLYHAEIPSSFITHQLLIKTSLGKTIDNYFQEINYRYINRFTECWVPDNASSKNIAGELSHPVNLPAVPLHYTGPLSRFAYTIEPGANKHILIILSGPEPQRTILEEILLEQLKGYHEQVVFVRGLPGTINELNVESNISVYDHLTANELQEKMHQSFLVISRCGYSTIMDLAALKLKSILIPTPGQTEQEYLAGHLMKNNFALCIEQQKFRLKNALELASSFPYQLQNFNSENRMQEIVENFLALIETKKKTNNRPEQKSKGEE